MITPTDEDYWRGIILYGKNQATYKLALGKLLINYANRNFTKIPMDELADDFLSIYEDRVKSGKPQNKTIGRQTYVEQEIDNLKAGLYNREKSIQIVKEKALKNMVLQKFHTLFNNPIPKPFYKFSDDMRHLLLQDNLLNVFTDNQNQSLNNELFSRWDLLEHGFEDNKHEELIEIDEKFKIFKGGINVIDIGAAPGSWSQYASKVVKNGQIISIDLKKMETIKNTIQIEGDFTETNIQNKIKRRDFTLSDLLAYAPFEKGTLFSDLGEEVHIPRPIKEYPLIRFDRVFEAC